MLMTLNGAYQTQEEAKVRILATNRCYRVIYKEYSVASAG